MFTIRDFIIESNKIEGILREPTNAELKAHSDLLKIDNITIAILQEFVFALQPGARLRETADMNVQVGKHIAPSGGVNIVVKLNEILSNLRDSDPYEVHRQYENLHPFMDGNGRSGRALWLWMMDRKGELYRALKLGFLHNWYYQSLDAKR